MDLNGKDSNVEGSVLGVWNVNCKNKTGVEINGD